MGFNTGIPREQFEQRTNKGQKRKNLADAEKWQIYTEELLKMS